MTLDTSGSLCVCDFLPLSKNHAVLKACVCVHVWCPALYGVFPSHTHTPSVPGIGSGLPVISVN